MYPGTWAATTPDKPALVMAGSGRTLTYAELDERSLRLARHLRATGLGVGDVVALVSDNCPEAYEVYWACLRSGLYVTAVNHHLSAEETSYVVRDCGAKALVVSAAKADLVSALDVDVPERLAYLGAVDGYADYEAALAAAGTDPLPAQPHGDDLLYSSGTTGRPRASRRRCPRSRSRRRATATSRSSAASTASARTPSTSPRRRSTTRRRCASGASCTPSAARW
ncbi:MAG: AMP-binding protein [Nocardioides sp.]